MKSSCTYRRLYRVKKSALSLVDEMLLLSFELKGKVRKDKTNISLLLKITTINTRSNYEEQAFTYRLWVKKSPLSSVNETLLL